MCQSECGILDACYCSHTALSRPWRTHTESYPAALVGQVETSLPASLMRRQQRVQIREIRRRKANRVNPALPPAQPSDAFAFRALLSRPRLSALRLCLLHRDLFAHAGVLDGFCFCFTIVYSTFPDHDTSIYT